MGEPSGDLHTAKLIDCLRNHSRGLSFHGFGGPLMAQAGCHIRYPLTDLAVVGFAEVLPKLMQFVRVADMASAAFDQHRPDAVVLVDFPGFNWHIAKRAKRRGIPVFYYLPPQLWAWGRWRIGKMRRTVDHVLCNLPFELEWYQQHGIPAHYVGHPFFDEVLQGQLDQKFLDRWSHHPGVQVSVLPGSRAREVRYIWPMQLEAIRRLAHKHPHVRFMVACLKDGHCLWCRQQLTEADRDLDIQFFVGRTSEIIKLSDCSLMKSGSVSLEMMARGVPSVVVYHIGRMTYHIARRLTDLSCFSLPNILAGRQVMSEHLAVGATDQAIHTSTQALERLIADPHERARQRRELLELNQSIAAAGASDRAAQLILSELDASQPSQSLVRAA
ncbi:MAG: lipid-A-disaccharide synthase [Pirellulaceae bacterium]|nr:lipid-A-disaccharide synthase [Pirellulaceae bacterium]